MSKRNYARHLKKVRKHANSHAKRLRKALISALTQHHLGQPLNVEDITATVKVVVYKELDLK